MDATVFMAVAAETGVAVQNFCCVNCTHLDAPNKKKTEGFSPPASSFSGQLRIALQAVLA
jgi:hypothetical protein